MKKVLIFDTDILCVYFQIPNMEDCGPLSDRWTKTRIDQLIAKEEQEKTIFVLPLAAIIETGNHITQSSGNRYVIAQEFAELMKKVANAKDPWAAFTEQAEFWEPESLKQLAEEWLKNVTQKLSLGDVTIKAIAEYYAKIGCQVEILTGDQGLKSYQPTSPQLIPRRRQR
ncbi:MAG: hypothetical protein VKL42_02530 [Snowella sp.]|nr:hypothetical protein [Snowella sp.]